MTATVTGVRPALIPPSTHAYADVIHRLEAGGSMLPDTPENLQQIIGIYKAYAVPMDFYWRDLLYIAERVFLNPLPAFKYFISQEYLDLPNSYAGDQSKLRIWRGGEKAHPELLEFMAKGETRAMPKLLHHLWHDRVNMEFAEACMQAMFWHQGMGGALQRLHRQRCLPGQRRSGHQGLLQGQPGDAGALQALPGDVP